MSFGLEPRLDRCICQVLHQEHEATLALMARLAALLERQRADPPDPSDRLTAILLSDVAQAMNQEVLRHFAFEEQELLPRLAADGEGALAAQLAEEHAALRPLMRTVAGTASVATATGFDPGAWHEFRRAAQELCQRLCGHVQEEEMGLLPLLEESLDETTDALLHAEYTGNE